MSWDEGRIEVRREMGRLGVTMDDLAYKLRRNGYRVSSSTVKKWLRGEMRPRYDGVREIVLVLAQVSAGDSPKGREGSQLQFPEVFRSTRERSHEAESAPRKRTCQYVAA